MNSVVLIKCQRFTPSGCKAIALEHLILWQRLSLFLTNFVLLFIMASFSLAFYFHRTVLLFNEYEFMNYEYINILEERKELNECFI